MIAFIYIDLSSALQSTWASGLVVKTFAYHARGPGFESPRGRNYSKIQNIFFSIEDKCLEVPLVQTLVTRWRLTPLEKDTFLISSGRKMNFILLHNSQKPLLRLGLLVPNRINFQHDF